MPHECYNLLKEYLLLPTTSLNENSWGLVLDWLLVASQGDNKKKCSFLAMKLDAVVCEDNEVQVGVAEHVDKTTCHNTSFWYTLTIIFHHCPKKSTSTQGWR
jgi:hypothetical protein